MRVREVLETCLYVNDLAAAEAFYRDLLGLEFFDRQEGHHLFFRCGQQMFLLFDPRASSHSDGKIPPHGASGPGHVCFAAREDELPAWQAHLSAAGIGIESVVDWPGGGRSIYFRDPAGNCLEIGTPRIWRLAKRP